MLTPSQRDALLVLMRALVDHGSIVAITGAAGAGKTAVLRSVMSGRVEASTQLIWCDSKDGEPLTLARILLDVAGRLPDMDTETGADAGDGRESPAADVVAANASIIVVDDAHLLTPEAAAYLVSVLDFVVGKAVRIHLILIGRPALWSVLHSAGIAGRVCASSEVSGVVPDLAAPGRDAGGAMERPGGPDSDDTGPGGRLPVAGGSGGFPVPVLSRRPAPAAWEAFGGWPSLGRVRARLGRLAPFRAESITEIRVLSGAVVLAVGSLALYQLLNPVGRPLEAPAALDGIVEPPSAQQATSVAILQAANPAPGPPDAAVAPLIRRGAPPTPARPGASIIPRFGSARADCSQPCASPAVRNGCERNPGV